MARLALFLSMLLGLAGPAAAAKSVFTVYGSNGDAGATDECPAGSYFTGIVGSVGAWIDQISVVCGTLRPDGSVSGGKSLPSRGGSGGGFKSVLCGKDEVITSMTITRNESYQIQELVFRCSNLKSGGGGGRHFGGGGSFVPGGPSHACQSGQAGTGMTIRYGKHVNGIGLICNDYRAPAAPPPAQADVSAICTGYAGRMAKAANELRTAKCNISSLGAGLTTTDFSAHQRTCMGLKPKSAKDLAVNERPVSTLLAKCLADGGGDDGGGNDGGGAAKLTKATEDTDLYDKPPPTNGGKDDKKVTGTLKKGRQAQLISCRSDKWCKLATGWVWGEHIKPGAN